ncbi:MAG: SDR family oxidoreductase [Proteobacteria bacterium]|jgi:2-hydroxycyclohexanecarboxyl-CoA dehydrogenase|nr:SDR family oxidoreductase [Pseudomonadota bacterium]
MAQDLNLRERTVVVLGPFSTTVQNLMIHLTEAGADVALVDTNAHEFSRFCTNLTDQREANPKLGRAVAVAANLQDPQAIRDGLAKVAQSFGSIDIFIDAYLYNKTSPLDPTRNDYNWELEYANHLKPTMAATQYVINFVKNRKRGRLLYLLNESVGRGSPQNSLANLFRGGLVYWMKSLSRQLHDSNITVNCLSIGMTEEYLLGTYPECKTIQEALTQAKLADPFVKLTEPEKITNMIMLLVSPLGSAINGQHLVLT